MKGVIAMTTGPSLFDQLWTELVSIKVWLSHVPRIISCILSGLFYLCRMLPIQEMSLRISDSIQPQQSLVRQNPVPKVSTKTQCDAQTRRTELLFGREQSRFRKNSPGDEYGKNSECVESATRENTAKSLKNLIDQLDTAASLGEISASDEKSSSNITPRSEPCTIIQKTESLSKRNTAVVNLRDCNLRLVKEVVRKLGLRDTKTSTREWDVYWTTNPISVMKCRTFNLYQRTNHFPESSRPLLKNNLAKYLTRMSSKCPQDYNFFPETWCLPEEFVCLEAHARRQPNEWFIVKPHNCSSGHGIFITKDLRELSNCGKMVCQSYIQRPLLIDGYKFDLRIYVLVTSCKPLRIFVYNDGFARLGTEPYQTPNRRNEKHRRMHLTNYSVNKHSPNCVVDNAKGTLRKLSTFNEWLAEQGVDVQKITNSIDDIIVKTTIAIAPVFSHYYYLSFPDHRDSNSCFQILGFDVMFDEDLKPYVLEVNADPSLYSDIQMERELKEELILDTFNILSLTKKPRRALWLSRPQSRGEKLVNDRKVTQSRIEWENSHMGNYRKVYPCSNMAHYEEFLKTAENVAVSI